VKGIWIGLFLRVGHHVEVTRLSCHMRASRPRPPATREYERYLLDLRQSSGHVANCQRSKGVEKVKGKGSAVPRGRHRAAKDEQNVQEKDEDSSCRA
jgi:hypothetical protein